MCKTQSLTHNKPNKQKQSEDGGSGFYYILDGSSDSLHKLSTELGAYAQVSADHQPYNTKKHFKPNTTKECPSTSSAS